MTRRRTVLWEKRPATASCYGPPGRAYVYFIYGVHYCVNTVCRRAGHAEAVLIRAIEAEFGEGLMRANRPAAKRISLSNGPGKLCAALAIDRQLDGADLCDSRSKLFVAVNPNFDSFRKERGPIVTTTRIGITQAAHLHLRFYLERQRVYFAAGSRVFAAIHRAIRSDKPARPQNTDVPAGQTPDLRLVPDAPQFLDTFPGHEQIMFSLDQ